ncbi:sensor histidine kinase [Micromonospora auratinigra]|uniref:histidine kinase n=1 Tax=Micromonospora auratinigra TaxID=261654 RepID=A0A1A8ZF29_9ACTN|nr:sensor histidine kinase [Micromonospora auratinigra]SBT42412.1 Signal transduction histidine kinase [Micromonospora auratinigra]
MTVSRRLLLTDLVWAVLLVLLVAYTVTDPPGPAYPGPTGVLWSTAVLIALPVAVRRRWPVAVLAVVLVAAVTATAAGVAGAGMLVVEFLPAATALYTVALMMPPRRSVPGLVAGLAGAAAAVGFFYAHRLPALPRADDAEVPLWAPGEIGVTVALLVLCWSVGCLVRWRRDVAARLARSLAHAAVVDERLRIARDLHDIVGHSMSLIAVKATVANHLADTRPDEVRAALTVIEETSRSGLADLRRALGVLRAEGTGEIVPADLAPTAGPAELAELAERAGDAGVRVVLRIGGVDDLPPALGLTAYRVVQEALTNVIRHAAPTTCRVTVEVVAGSLRMEVTDDGPPVRVGAPPGAGRGLAGMRERVTLYGGALTAGPRPEGGFRVRASVPVTPSGRSG